jgi:carbon monoxide dehydrogenase subunit G
MTRAPRSGRLVTVMRTWTATANVDAPPDAVLDVLTDPGACARWAPIEFQICNLDSDRLEAGSQARLSGRLAGVPVAFDVDVLAADAEGLELRAAGPVALDVRYDLLPDVDGSEVRASIGVVPGRGVRGVVFAEAMSAVLRAGALHTALSRIGREAAAVALA